MNVNLALTLPETRKQSIGSVVLTSLKNIVAAVSDRAATTKPEPHPYSFQSECECPDDCLRDHENE
jgi:hypothetical protein